MDAAPGPGQFLCPECAGVEELLQMMVRWQQRTENPWTHFARVSVCVRCRRSIPTHIAEWWDNRTIVEARATWCRLYRDRPESGPNEKFLASLGK